ncbi:MAG: hypothetical protein M3P34_04765, partial [Actinomycetota bacterium]|nr:hypothetical protein [Actinomycetota bacterium]
ALGAMRRRWNAIGGWFFASMVTASVAYVLLAVAVTVRGGLSQPASWRRSPFWGWRLGGAATPVVAGALPAPHQNVQPVVTPQRRCRSTTSSAGDSD